MNKVLHFFAIGILHLTKSFTNEFFKLIILIKFIKNCSISVAVVRTVRSNFYGRLSTVV